MHSFNMGYSHCKLRKLLLNIVCFGNVHDSELLSSFFLFLPKTEASLLEKFDGSDAQPILDILTEYKIFERPTVGNINRLITKAVNVALIRLPSFAMGTIIKGMGKFWSSISREMFSSLYECIRPNAIRVIDALVLNELQQADGKIGTWLHRFIRNCTHQQLVTFVRFVTGSTNLWPGDTIKVEFVDQPKDFLRPISQTCFKILRLPRQYVSYTELATNIISNMSIPDNWMISDKLLAVEDD